MTSAILPFLTIPEDLVQITPWKIGLSTGEKLEDPEFVPNWDNATNLLVSCEFSLDPSSAASSIDIPNPELEILVFAGTGAGTLPSERWLAFRGPVKSASPISIQFEIAGSRMAENLFLDAVIGLSTAPGTRNSSIAPARAGDIVWRERRRIRLEGNVSRFPVSETDLSRLLGEEWRDALWRLQVDWSDPAADFDTAVRLHVNSQNKAFSERFRKGDRETLQTVMADVIAQISRDFLRQSGDQDISSGDISESSLAGVSLHWLVTAFGSADAARRDLEADPGRFHARLNALAAVGDE
ncbi:hypothetical protein GS636_06890 [Ruegeria sp. HKCCD4884]|uniref:hypothetical protein n=1 Tax=Ruegeria sp. HKCCD4884 TaxID=2683022 RepID=UPI0014921F08|nr:hypothetical protein [Ruegeria sp. HKCCD4884]NOD92507.1 hypothetical protein [Ruegeria sp. HKCCD4884]